MNYILINVHCDEPFRDILIAEMGQLEFDSFVETEVGFEAYIEEETFNHPALQVLFNDYRQPLGSCQALTRALGSIAIGCR